MFERAFVSFAPPTSEEWDALLPKFRSNVEGATPPSAKPAAQAPQAIKAAPSQPAKIRIPTPQAAHYNYYQAANIPAPPPPPPPPTLQSKLKKIAKAFAWWIAVKTGLLLKIIIVWLIKELQWLVVAAAKEFRRHGGIEATVSALALLGLFWFFKDYEARLTAKQSPAAQVSKPPAPIIADRPVKTTTEPPRAATPQQPTLKKTAAPPPPAEEPEILPWLTKEVPPPKMQPLSAPETAPLKRKVYPRNLREYRRMREREQRADNTGWTQRGRSSEYRLAPSAKPTPVSYTHLDVYKRQHLDLPL